MGHTLEEKLDQMWVDRPDLPTRKNPHASQGRPNQILDLWTVETLGSVRSEIMATADRMGLTVLENQEDSGDCVIQVSGLPDGQQVTLCTPQHNRNHIMGKLLLQLLMLEAHASDPDQNSNPFNPGPMDEIQTQTIERQFGPLK